jgi:hypothetical protein
MILYYIYFFTFYSYDLNKAQEYMQVYFVTNMQCKMSMLLNKFCSRKVDRHQIDEDYRVGVRDGKRQEAAGTRLGKYQKEKITNC